MRTVETVEELEALPVYTVVRDWRGASHVRCAWDDGTYSWVRAETCLNSLSADLLARGLGPFEVVSSPQNETIEHHLREARAERDRAVAENERLKADLWREKRHPDGLGELAKACVNYPSEDWQKVAARLSRESQDSDVRDVAEALERSVLASRNNFEEVERVHSQLEEARKRIGELEAGRDVATVAGRTRQQWLDYAGYRVQNSDVEWVPRAAYALQIVEQMREADA